MVLLSVTAYLNAESFIALFRNDPEVITIGTTALHWYCISLVLMPVTMYGNMLFQSIGRAKVASFLAALRSGLTLIPCIILLNAVFGLSGLEKAQSIAEILSVIITIPFLYYFFKHQPEDGQEA